MTTAKDRVIGKFENARSECYRGQWAVYVPSTLFGFPTRGYLSGGRTESEAWENAQWHLEKSDDRKG